ncbi:endoribonuclease Dicer homolog 1 [Coffea arabica]|uniref:Endoribonuclease Dicer homolog 1 n=1 Tax=Coffea arabica TaxID=13443 RepID=A0A6P6SRX2_COFAR|nr:endoribonuclease Dicer homolog 1-like isoform X1 [Coffea arabica]XP_027068550.1 endoribonuclease Dicer homolog 1-like isoform X1 [Coffea arabica]XP_027068551.1 endoribonuclease Dicer homolog 1-like isoform X1 [Coffea arabica]XP_027068552.1 endoribonuclease Dicer homolog 1-like isoform X1 [Coffea arabica]XP_027068553.1 endoribonuclease Dicer homolog 1-like isoform X1 [Coffea arabica]XP_027068554.1 endoribonuclease Dicer homolog 1-like isoform X1 [Coffea arabica]XP_027068555.1 endoribonuclea
MSFRKRPRDGDEMDWCHKDRMRRRQQHYGSSRKDTDWREARGYWERDKERNEMVFHLGSWEADQNRAGMTAPQRSCSGSEGTEKEAEEPNGINKLPEEQARQYQLDVLEQAKTKNTIAFLETGAGKTLIAVLLIRSISSDLQSKNKKMLAVFLVPKVPLVYQQAEVIRERTGYQVGHYCGEMGQDFWDARRWQREFETKQVLVMTAQILLNILRHSIIKMEAIDLLILDECHHAVKKHPYSLVMSEFYHTTSKEQRPSVFGMTASPVNLKGVSSQIDCAIKIRNLECKLDSVVCTVKDRKELERHVPMPSEVVVEYDKATSLWSLHEQIKQMEVAVEEAAQSSSRRSKWQFMGARDAGAKEELRQVYGVSERTESDGAANLIQKLRAVNYALGELGQWCAYKVAQSFLAGLQNDERANYQLDVKFQESYLSKVVSLLQCQLSEGAVSESNSRIGDLVGFETSESSLSEEIEEGELPDSHVVSGGEHVDVIIGAAVADGKVTPKVQSLIKILLKYQHTDDFRAIVFVERVVAALVLPKVFAELPSLSFIKSASLIGHNNSQEMRTSQLQDAIAKFRDGRVTLLVATSVAEEGLDIRQCNVVIRFDLAKTVLAYIQSRGRARKPGSDYILMVERGNLSHEAFLRNARNSEETLRKEAIERTDISHLNGTSKLGEVTENTVYQVESTGAVVSLNSAVGLIHFYCSQLPSDRYSILRPEFIMQRHEKPGGPTGYSCRLQLPCNAPFEELEGPVCGSMRVAQQAVCLAACKKLHEMGAFTDMLLPDKGSGADLEKVEKNDEGDPLPGTARHREFYPEGVAKVLQGDWILTGRDNCDYSKFYHLYMYEVKCVNFGSSKDPFLTQVSEFAVLFGNELDAEVLSMSMDLFIARTVITKASLIYRGPLEITEIQLALLKSFHVRLMSIVLDVDVEPSTTPWDPAKAYLFVPTTCNKTTDPIKDIDWDLIERITNTDAWRNPIQRARPDVCLGTNERALGGDRREYGFGKLRHGITYGLKSHPTYGIRGAIAQFDVVEASGLLPNRNTLEVSVQGVLNKDKLMMADSCVSAEDLVGKIITAAHSGKRFFVDSVRYDMTAENPFPRKEGYLGPLEYSSYADYYKQKYGVHLIFKQQPLIRGRGVSYCKNLLSPRFEHAEAHDNESDENLDKTYYVFLPPELCFVHPLPGSLVRGAQRLPSIMRRVESMLLAVQLKHIIGHPVPASKILEALTAASCQETFCYERAELLGDAYLKWVVSRFLFLQYPQKHEGQLTRMRQQMVSNMVLYQYALNKGLQSYIQADRFAPSRWAAPGVLPVFDEEMKETEASLFDPQVLHDDMRAGHDLDDGLYEDDELEDGELESDSSSYRVLSSKTLADVVEALIGVYYVEGGKIAANHVMKWIGIEVDFDLKESDYLIRPNSVPENVLRSIDFDVLETTLNIKFVDRSLLVEAITHASRPSSGVSCYQRLEFVGDAVLDHLITRHLFFTYTDLPPGRLTDLRAAAVNNENFARVAVKHNLHTHLRHGSSALEKQIRDFVKEVQNELSKPGFNSFGLGDCKAPKVLGDIVESIAGAVFLDSGRDTAAVWRVFQPLLEPMVTPETLPMHPVRELQERCQQQAEGLEYKATRSGNLATVEVYVDGVQVGLAQNPQKKMAQKLAARNALVALKEKEKAEAKENDTDDGKKRRNGSQTFTRQTLNDICLRRNWPMPSYRRVHEGGPAHAKRFTYAVCVKTSDRGWTDECIGDPMPSVKKAKDSAAVLLLELLNKWYA